MNTYIIAEIGVNHSGSISMAKKMIDAAKKSGANAVKFQTFKAEKLVSFGTPKVKYQESTTAKSETHFEMIKSLEFAYEDHLPVLNYCKTLSLDFISTPYDVESAEFLVSIGVEVFKTASADIVDISLHKFIAQKAKHAIVSTGMATLGEIEQVVEIYRKHHCKHTLLHCVSNYPCQIESLNMNVLTTLKSCFLCDVGYSDHAVGVYPAVIAVSLGATMVEKHFTLDKSMIGPDHKASSDPAEFAELVNAVRATEVSLGGAFKTVQEEEKQMRNVSRKSLFLTRNINKGEILNFEDFTLKRPGTGIFEFELTKILGCKASSDLEAERMLQYGDFSNS